MSKVCPDCGTEMAAVEGCGMCPNCGHSPCK